MTSGVIWKLPVSLAEKKMAAFPQKRFTDLVSRVGMYGEWSQHIHQRRIQSHRRTFSAFASVRSDKNIFYFLRKWLDESFLMFFRYVRFSPKSKMSMVHEAEIYIIVDFKMDTDL
jgi:hypothetical protein